MLSVPQHVTVWTPKILFLIGHTEIERYIDPVIWSTFIGTIT